jgi:hypothetical protein
MMVVPLYPAFVALVELKDQGDYFSSSVNSLTSSICFDIRTNVIASDISLPRREVQVLTSFSHVVAGHQNSFIIVVVTHFH